MIDKIDLNKCTGCNMCGDLCPVSAISYHEDKYGFLYPVVNQDKCIQCEKCIKSCPSLNPSLKIKMNEPEVYAAWSKDDQIRTDSTSGGLFYEFGKYVIENKGVVSGVAYNNDWKSAKNIVVSDLEGLERLKGSKYFQSNASNVYQEVQKALMDENIKMVLFCGTPCQNAALKSFLGKEYDQLYCIDFICRSINSPKAFQAYIDELEEKYNSRVVNVHLKSKINGWQSLASQVDFKNGQQSLEDKNSDWWVKGFIYNDLYTRPVCHQCQYKELPRCSTDITIGDFWGIKGQTEENLFKGISVMMINSQKGKVLLSKIKQKLELEKTDLDDVLPGNPSLLKNPPQNNKIDKFFRLLNKYKFSKSVKICMNKSLWGRCKDRMKRLLRKMKKIVWIKKNLSLWKFIKYNYFTKNIIRDKGTYIYPYKNAILDIDRTAKIYLHGKNCEIGINKLKGSRAETHVRLDAYATWNCNNGCGLFYDTVLEIKENAVFDSGYFTANSGSVIISDLHICFGEDVMLGRNIIVYDSDFHQIKNENGTQMNGPSEVIIEDHAWLTSNINVNKGVRIGKNSLITAQTVVVKDVPPNTINGGHGLAHVIKEGVTWSRERVNK